ncbi:uncharacterized protein TNCV_2814631 [Trichonephila clavipes]|nr:uncharacterized protein TNCV_2814631 [Trichonephila clavipes]
MLMFQTPVQTSAFMRRRERNANCLSSRIQASMTESPVNSLSRNSYSCGDCERRTQCSGSTAPLMSSTYYQISVLKAVMGATFLDMLTLRLMLQLQDNIDNILQLDDAPPHWSANVRDYLD